MSRVIIVGGGLAGGLAALALATRRQDVDVTLVEEGDAIGGNHIWSFFDSDIVTGDRWLLDKVKTTRWEDHDVRFPERRRTIGLAYNSIRSEDFRTSVSDALAPDRLKLGVQARSVAPTSVVLENGECLEADCVVDARGQASSNGFELGWQKFVGRRLRFSEPHRVPRPVIMDATIAQLDGYRFIYRLPFSERELLVEDTYYSSSPLLEEATVRSRLDQQSAAIGAAEILGEERGVLPVVLSGDVATLWRGEPVPRLGVRGGFFHPTTSYSLPDAVANATLLSDQSDFSSAAIYALFKDRAARLWNERSFFRLLNRMLFGAAPAAERYRVFEHFYRLPAPLIARFYSGKLGAFDKIRILSGRPPVPIGKALAALRALPA